MKSLSLKEELFCQYYTQNSECFGIATLAYDAAYGKKLDEQVGKKKDAVRRVCSVEGSKMLRSPKIQTRLTELLNELLEDKVVDRELARVIMQNTELSAKIAGIKEYNKLRQRIVEKTDITSKGEALVIFDENQTKRVARRILTGATAGKK